MPRGSLRSLIAQGELAGVPIVLRGLVNNSVEDTMQAVHSLYVEGERQESGAVIDPTLFERFDIKQVPTVVVAETPAVACSVEACPTPAHVKIAGDVPLRYSLDRIALAEPAFRNELRVLMKKLEPERKW
jgi:conjugal transfer pilus assembly protein TrbC